MKSAPAEPPKSFRILDCLASKYKGEAKDRDFRNAPALAPLVESEARLDPGLIARLLCKPWPAAQHRLPSGIKPTWVGSTRLVIIMLLSANWAYKRLQASTFTWPAVKDGEWWAESEKNYQKAGSKPLLARTD